MANEQPPAITILVNIFIPVLAVAVAYGIPFVNLVLFEGIVVAVLGLYGISAFLRARVLMVKRAFDLFPGFIEDRMIVGFNAIASSAFLFIENVMPQDNFIAIVTLVLSGLGLLGLSVHLASNT